MSDIDAIRKGIATNMASVEGLRTSDYWRDNPRPPIAMVLPDTIDYDLNANRGADEMQFLVSVLVGRADDRAAQRTADQFIVGPNSVKDAIESDRTLGGAANTCRVTRMRSYGQVSIGEVIYLELQFEVEVVA